MSDRHHALTVVLDADMREEDLEPLRLAIAQLRGVADVVPVVASLGDYMARARVRAEIASKLYTAVRQIIEP